MEEFYYAATLPAHNSGSLENLLKKLKNAGWQDRIPQAVMYSSNEELVRIGFIWTDQLGKIIFQLEE